MVGAGGRRHAHRDPAELLDDDVSKSHTVVVHHEFQCLQWRAVAENPYLLEISSFDRYLVS